MAGEQDERADERDKLGQADEQVIRVDERGQAVYGGIDRSKPNVYDVAQIPCPGLFAPTRCIPAIVRYTPDIRDSRACTMLHDPI